MRRVVDCVVSAVCLVVAAVPMVLIGVAVTLVDGPPPLFVQVRTGRDFKRFRLLKFRTMRSHGGSLLTVEGDARVTPLGRWLRRYHLDELPQLFNILVGDMSFIGPRPEVPQFVDPTCPIQQQVWSVRPGLFDEATLVSLDEGRDLAREDDPERWYRTTRLPIKLAHSLEGIRARSLSRDLALLRKLVPALARSARAAEGPAPMDQ